jgi:hypothetical protein
MPKVLCLIGLVISILVFLLFTLDLVLGISGLSAMAPFQSVSMITDIMAMLASGALIYASWTTFREQK